MLGTIPNSFSKPFKIKDLNKLWKKLKLAGCKQPKCNFIYIKFLSLHYTRKICLSQKFLRTFSLIPLPSIYFCAGNHRDDHCIQLCHQPLHLPPLQLHLSKSHQNHQVSHTPILDTVERGYWQRNIGIQIIYITCSWQVFLFPILQSPPDVAQIFWMTAISRTMAMMSTSKFS